MLLTIDVGNTQTTLGLFSFEGKILRQWRMATAVSDTSDELHFRLNGYLNMMDLAPKDIEAAVLASVVPRLTFSWENLLHQHFDDSKILTISSKRDCGIEIAMPYPESVGADRIANALAAKVLYGPSSIVVDFGTATNIDVVDAQGKFRGGAIMPGLMLSANSLFAKAARLANVELKAPAQALGTTTEEALQSGIVIGAAAQVEGLVARIKAELNEPHATVIATGGFAQEICKASTLFDVVCPDLTLQGIYLIWKHRNDKRAARLQQS